jgi:hypothetical protein
MLRRIRAGRVKSAVTIANAENTAIPTRRKGNKINQIRGKSKRARKAIGQQSTSRMHQRRNFTISPFLPLDLTLPAV